MKVKAIRAGFYGDYYRKPGDVFHLKDDADFSRKWMKNLDKPVEDEPASEEVSEESGKKRRKR